MKTTLTTSDIAPLATSALRYERTRTIGKTKCRVSIRLNDECKNGHEDFAITGETCEHRNGRWQEDACGCIHEEITRFFPDLAAIFVPLHLADWEGSASHCVSNARFHLQQGKDQFAQDTLRCTNDELNTLRAFMHDGDLFFSYQMEKMGLRERYKAEALQATAKLEALVNAKAAENAFDPEHNRIPRVYFVSKATRQQWPSLSAEQVLDLQTKEEAGYFTPEAAAERLRLKVEKEAAEEKAPLREGN